MINNKYILFIYSRVDADAAVVADVALYLKVNPLFRLKFIYNSRNSAAGNVIAGLLSC